MLAAAIGAAATVAAAGIALEDRVLEERHIHRLEAGGEEAKVAALGWLADHGGERTLMAFAELYATRIPAGLLLLDPNKAVSLREAVPDAIARSGDPP